MMSDQPLGDMIWEGNGCRGRGQVRGSHAGDVEDRHAAKRQRKKLRRIQARRRKLLFYILQGLFFVAIGLLAFGIRQSLLRAEKTSAQSSRSLAGKAFVQPAGEEQNAGQLVACSNGQLVEDYASYCALDEVEAPAKRGAHEVRQKLGLLSAEYPLIKEIYDDLSAYPEDMLEALANNPEMADFVAGYPKADRTSTGGLTELEKNQKYPLFLQWDPRWGYHPYGDGSNIGLAGCATAALSMALYYLNGDAAFLPDKIAEYAMENDYYMSGTGTKWALIEDVPPKYGVLVDELSLKEEAMRRTLDAGNILISTMRPGDFTAAGHFIVIYGYDADGFLVNDPNCVARSRRSWTFAELGWQIKQMWSLGKE